MTSGNMKKILGATIGNCVHVAGLLNFLDIAKKSGYETKFLGCAVSTGKLKDFIKELKPDIVGLSYRLSPESATRLFREINREVISPNPNITFMLGTTKSVADFLSSEKLSVNFDKIFTGGENAEDIRRYFYDTKLEDSEGRTPPQNLTGRITFKKPFPVIRHHFGRPTMEETENGIKEISESGEIDILSLGPDQSAQEFFFEPDKMNKLQDGAGGVPVRSKDDFRKLYIASRRGNWPLMRCYSGTNNIIEFAKVLIECINNAWCAVPLCWYNELDGRSSRKLEDSIAENLLVVKWHADKGVPVEINESHHWSLRYAHDPVAVAAAYLAAYNAKKQGVNTYVSQYMFNTPPETSFTMDLAKMLAKAELIESLHDENFTSVRETRTGLFSMPQDFYRGKGQLASSTLLQMQMDPSIVHVVAFCESSYAAKPADILESCSIVGQVIENYIAGCPDMKKDKDVILRKNNLITEAKQIIEKIKTLKKDIDKKEYDKYSKDDDPLINPAVIALAIRKGILDAPHLQGKDCSCGTVRTMFFNGANYATDESGNILNEEERLNVLN
jgi:hypothetical protein